MTGTLSAGLPNITGTVGTVVSTSGGLSGSGAFTATNSGRGGGDDAWWYGSIQFDAARCNPVYGKSNTVQSAAINLAPQVKY